MTAGGVAILHIDPVANRMICRGLSIVNPKMPSLPRKGYATSAHQWLTTHGGLLQPWGMKMFRQDFPSGAPGAAFLLMRASLAGVLASVSLNCDGMSPLVAIPAAVLACLIAAGFLARLAALALALVGVAAIGFGRLPFTDMPIVIDGCALTLLGPGAWSIDAWRLNQRAIGLNERSPHRR